MKTQGEIEAAICDGITRFQQEYMGRGPKDIRSHLIGDRRGGCPVHPGRIAYLPRDKEEVATCLSGCPDATRLHFHIWGLA